MRKNRQGFTLIELMIVIGIIGIVAGVAMPNIRQARNKALATDCFNSIRLLTNAVDVFKTNNNSEPQNMEALMPFISGKQVPKCPLGGEYRFQQKTSGEDNLVVECTLHGCSLEAFNEKGSGSSSSGGGHFNLH